MNPDEIALTDRHFEGGAFHPDLPGGRASGAVVIKANAVQFKSESGSFELPLEGLKLELGGANDRLIFFSAPTRPPVTIHTADHGILEHPVIGQHPALAAQRTRVRRKKRVASAVLLAVVGALIGAVVLLVLSKNRLVTAAGNRVPAEWEVKVGDKLFDQIILTKRVIKDAELEAQLKLLTDPLVNGIPGARYPLQFHVVEDATLNAFAIPGGHTVVHSGLLMAADTPEEVAGVLAHEIAHVTRRHSIRSLISSAGLYIVLSAVLGDTSGLLAVLADNSAFLLDRKFSRDFEREADETGWDYLRRSAIDPRGMVAFFRRMQREETRRAEKRPGAGVEEALAVLSTHPDTAERIKTLETRWSQMAQPGRYRKFPLDYAGFRQKLRAKLHAPGQEKQSNENNH